jgi:hypothetical protein
LDVRGKKRNETFAQPINNDPIAKQAENKINLPPIVIMA